MGWFVLTGLLIGGVLLAEFFLAAAHTEPNGRSSGFNSKPWMIAVPVMALFVWIVITAFCSTDTVANGHIGIKKQFSSLVGTTGEGLVTHAPWQSVAEVSVQNELRTYEMNQNNSAVSSDSQPVFLVVQVNYSLQRDEAVPLYRETGGHFVERILDPAVYQNVKAQTANYKAIDFAKNRELIRLKIEKALSAEVGKHGITINNVALRNVDFTQQFSQAIEKTVVAEQDAKASEQTVKIKKAEAQQKVAEAKGSAEATLVQARADAQAQKLKQKTLTPLLVQMEAIAKLNPNVQVIVCDSGKNCVPQAFVQVKPTGSGN